MILDVLPRCGMRARDRARLQPDNYCLLLFVLEPGSDQLVNLISYSGPNLSTCTGSTDRTSAVVSLQNQFRIHTSSHLIVRLQSANHERHSRLQNHQEIKDSK